MRASNVVLLCSIPLLTLLAPVVKEKAAVLVAPSSDTYAYEGDGILIADTSSYQYVWWWWPSIFTTRWTLKQNPGLGDAYHSVSFYVAPKSIAHRFLYRFDSYYESDFSFVEGGPRDVSQGQQHLDLRRNIYLLPKEYTPGREARADYNVEVKKASKSFANNNKTFGYTLCQFQNRADYIRFLRMERGAIAYRCHCDYKDPLPCNGTEDCFDGRVSHYSCFDGSSVPNFSSSLSSYNFFSTIVPTKSYVKFTANITMYFYGESKLMKHAHYMCTIYDKDTCSFSINRPSWLYEPQLIIAQIHPKAGPFALTTTITVSADIIILKNVAWSTLYLLIPCLLLYIVIYSSSVV